MDCIKVFLDQGQRKSFSETESLGDFGGNGKLVWMGAKSGSGSQGGKKLKYCWAHKVLSSLSVCRYTALHCHCYALKMRQNVSQSNNKQVLSTNNQWLIFIKNQQRDNCPRPSCHQPLELHTAPVNYFHKFSAWEGNYHGLNGRVVIEFGQNIHYSSNKVEVLGLVEILMTFMWLVNFEYF